MNLTTMMKKYNKLFLMLFLPFALPMLVFAQQAQMEVSTESSFSIDGTSNLRNWSATSQEVSGNIEFSETFQQFPFPQLEEKITGLSFTLPGKSLNGSNKGMDPTMHRALKVNAHPEITYELAEASVTEVNESSFYMDTKGTLTVAGKAQEISMVVMGKPNEGGGFSFTGKHELKMTQFDIKPPTALFGQIEAGDDVTVQFTLVVVPKA